MAKWQINCLKSSTKFRGFSIYNICFSYCYKSFLFIFGFFVVDLQTIFVASKIQVLKTNAKSTNSKTNWVNKNNSTGCCLLFLTLLVILLPLMLSTLFMLFLWLLFFFLLWHSQIHLNCTWCSRLVHTHGINCLLHKTYSYNCFN